MHNALLEKLIKARLVEPIAAEEIPKRFPWYVKLMLAFSGWVGALCILGIFFFVFSSFIENTTTNLLTSLVLLFMSFRILKAPNNEFFEHLALALSFVAQALFTWTLAELKHQEAMFFASSLFQALLVFIMPSLFLRICSTIFCAISLSSVFVLLGAPNILGTLLIFPMVWVCLNEFKVLEQFHRMKGVMYGLVVSTILLTGGHYFGMRIEHIFVSSYGTIRELPSWVSHSIYLFSLVTSCWYLLAVHNIRLNSKLTTLAFLFTALISLLTIHATGIGVGVLLLIVAFAQSNRVLMGLSVVSLLVYGSMYYSTMERTLLFKSGVLMLVALLMLACYLVLNKLLARPEEH